MPAPPRGRGGSGRAPGPAAPDRRSGSEPIGSTWERKHPTAAALRSRASASRSTRRARDHGTRTSSGLGPVPGPDRVLEHRRRNRPGRPAAGLVVRMTVAGPRREHHLAVPDLPRRAGRPARPPARSAAVGQAEVGARRGGQAEPLGRHRRLRPPDRGQPPGRFGGRARVRGLAVGGPEQPQVGAAPRPAPRAFRRRRAPRRPGGPRPRAPGDRRARRRRASARPAARASPPTGSRRCRPSAR